MIDLPWPPSELKPNVAKHWRAKLSAKKRYREDCYILTKARGEIAVQEDGNIPLKIIFFPPNARHFDLDNALAAFKAGMDGMAQALGVNDKRFRPITIDMGPVIKGGVVRIELVSGVYKENDDEYD